MRLSRYCSGMIRFGITSVINHGVRGGRRTVEGVTDAEEELGLGVGRIVMPTV